MSTQPTSEYQISEFITYVENLLIQSITFSVRTDKPTVLLFVDELLTLFIQ